MFLHEIGKISGSLLNSELVDIELVDIDFWTNVHIWRKYGNHGWYWLLNLCMSRYEEFWYINPGWYWLLELMYRYEETMATLVDIDFLNLCADMKNFNIVPTGLWII
jgi:hypothetical protein